MWFVKLSRFRKLEKLLAEALADRDALTVDRDRLRLENHAIRKILNGMEHQRMCATFGGGDCDCFKARLAGVRPA